MGGWVEREKKKKEKESEGEGEGTVQAAFNNKRVERPNSIQEEEEEGRDKTQSAVRGWQLIR